MQNFHYLPVLDELAHVTFTTSPKPGDETFNRVYNYIMKDLNYSGPLGLSCNNTKLLSMLCIYLDVQAECFFLVGHTGELIPIADTAELEALLKSKMLEKVTKVHVWYVQILMPKASLIVTYVTAIPNSLSAKNLQIYSDRIICGLVYCGLKIITYAYDGMETKHKIQCCLIRDSPSHVTYTITHSVLALHLQAISVIIATKEGQPIIMIQDSKHALKTMCNNNFSEVKVLTLGKYTAKYLDAPCCLFSASSLEYLSTHFPDHIGEIIYLFIFGELINAYQNHSISHITHIKMVLYMSYFVDIWSLFIDQVRYVKSKHFISYEATNIICIIIEGLLGLIFMHSSEVCKHVFMECRKLVKDFAFTDLIHMMPHLHIKSIAQDAWEEATNLFSILKVLLSNFLLASTSHPTLLRLDPVVDTNLSNVNVSDDEREESDSDMGDADKLDELVKALPDSGICRHAVDKCLFNLECTAVAVNLEDLVHLKIGSSLKCKEKWKASASRGLLSGNLANVALAAAQCAEVGKVSREHRLPSTLVTILRGTMIGIETMAPG
ncbi:hypothetical protein HETIRDRAFT_417989 [Heterobasidion irregulare TC 32-1]|uniref:Uncharacterized protein n=1 Tax=Heterobasidion irregulare (strain TC 32-1) TaxID=747525 RepID=W4K898_HETIT|nr:uncharacterized protein HETIRDRAFT_417989 [Heterobasidion irregulare TC 32-1]ETW81979.1 hypothetical protein HETIRDRAFT_417989 [Heterobasidion irregulare TC 32-1]